LAEGPIALVEVQAYVYAARKLAAACARKLGMADRAAALEKQAAQLQQRFEEAFWSEEIGTYVLALDGQKAPCKVRTSNAGQVLFTGIARPDRARRIATDLFHSSFNSGWGIRTVAQGEARYNPMSYHNGSIWPHDNALIAAGLARYGHKSGIGLLFQALMRATGYMDHRRPPELFCGFRLRKGRGPILYPAACAPQAWASGAPFQLLQSMLGLTFDYAARRIELINPFVPALVGDITIRNLRMGEASADFVVRQERGAMSLEVLKATDGLQVSLVFNPPAA
jgi:glycogen debranching enzyme